MADESTCTRKLKVLSDSTRLAVMELLMKKPSHVGPLVDALGVEQSLLSHHLKILREAEQDSNLRCWFELIYSLAPAAKVDSGKAINLGCCQLLFKPGQHPHR